MSMSPCCWWVVGAGAAVAKVARVQMGEEAAGCPVAEAAAASFPLRKAAEEKCNHHSFRTH